MWFGPLPVYFVTDAESVHRLLTDTANFGKGRIFDRAKRFLGEGILTSEGPIHLQHRRLIRSELSPRHVAEHTDAIRKAAEHQISRWREGRPIDVPEEMFSLAVNAISAVMFPDTPDPTKIANLRIVMDKAMKGAVMRTMLPPIASRIPLPANRRYDVALRTFHQTIDEMADNNCQPSDGTDLVTRLRTVPVPGNDQPMNPRARHDEIVSLFAAGTENTAATLSWLFHELSQHLQAEARLHVELDHVIGDRPIRYNDLSKLPFLRNLIQETLRLHGVWMFMRRARSTVELGGTRIPVGAEVAYSLHAIHRDPRTFPNPAGFIPDRWNTEPPKHAFIPFGAGSHKCLGDTFTIIETSIAVATIASKWQLKPTTPKPVRESAATNVVFPDQLTMRPERRPHPDQGRESIQPVDG